jgi:hypothetical protein
MRINKAKFYLLDRNPASIRAFAIEAGESGEVTMKKIFASVIIALCVAPASAYAGERTLDAGLGAAAGGIAFGWPGAAAGLAVGYIKGPDISRALRLSRHRGHYRRHWSRR